MATEAERWASRKARSLEVLPELGQVDRDRAAKLRACGSWFGIRHWVEQETSAMHAANFCQQPRLCQGCAHVRGVKLANSYAVKAGEVLREHPTLRPWLVTFTVRTGASLTERFAHLQHGISAMWQRVKDSKKRGRKQSQFSPIQGLVVSTEIKRSEAAGKLWQPHAHGLALVDVRDWSWTIAAGQGLVLDDMLHRPLCDEWQEITGDSYVLNAKPLASGLDLGAGAEVDQSKLFADLLEVFKYMTKPGSLTPADLVAVWQMLAGRRAVRAFGLLHGVEVPEDYDGERLGGDCWEVWHRWESGRYVADRSRFVPDERTLDGQSQP